MFSFFHEKVRKQSVFGLLQHAAIAVSSCLEVLMIMMNTKKDIGFTETGYRVASYVGDAEQYAFADRRDTK